MKSIAYVSVLNQGTLIKRRDLKQSTIGPISVFIGYRMHERRAAGGLSIAEEKGGNLNKPA